MNPARTLGPDIVGNDYTGWWVYVAGPVIGAAIAVMIIGGRPGIARQGGARGRLGRRPADPRQPIPENRIALVTGTGADADADADAARMMTP